MKEMQKITSETNLKQLTGHVSPETAFVINDYPFGFTLRCKMRHWIETTKNGQRFVSQTTNPRKQGEVWNKPKKSTYDKFSGIAIVDDPTHQRHGHVINIGCSAYASPSQTLAYLDKWSIDGYSVEQVAAYKAKIKALAETEKLNLEARQLLQAQAPA